MKALLRRLARPIRQQLRWWRTVLGAAAVAALPIASPPPAAAEHSIGPCAPRAELLAALAGIGFDIRVRYLDLGLLVELAASADGAWYQLATTPDGVACVLRAGDGFQAMPAGRTAASLAKVH